MVLLGGEIVSYERGIPVPLWISILASLALPDNPRQTPDPKSPSLEPFLMEG